MMHNQNFTLDYRRSGTDWPKPYRVQLFANKNERADHREVCYFGTFSQALDFVAMRNKQSWSVGTIPLGWYWVRTPWHAWQVVHVVEFEGEKHIEGPHEPIEGTPAIAWPFQVSEWIPLEVPAQ